jgi:hypothetical protein
LPQYQHNHPRSSTDVQLRTPHVELPIFTGEAPRAWLLECEDIFTLVQIPDTSKTYLLSRTLLLLFLL